MPVQNVPPLPPAPARASRGASSRGARLFPPSSALERGQTLGQSHSGWGLGGPFTGRCATGRLRFAPSRVAGRVSLPSQRAGYVCLCACVRASLRGGTTSSPNERRRPALRPGGAFSHWSGALLLPRLPPPAPHGAPLRSPRQLRPPRRPRAARRGRPARGARGGRARGRGARFGKRPSQSAAWVLPLAASTPLPARICVSPQHLRWR